MPKTNVLALDVGSRRVGIAVGDTDIKIPRLLPTLTVNDDVLEQLMRLIEHEAIQTIVVGYPRNQSGEPTEQTKTSEAFAVALRSRVDLPVVYQDESLTSIKAEERLQARGRPYTKSDIDAESAAIILSDYLERL